MFSTLFVAIGGQLDQRYFAGLSGRFLTADSSGLNESLAVAASWNQYSYVEGDPINFVDPEGLATCSSSGLQGFTGIPSGTTVSQVISARTDLSALSQTIFTESEAGVANNASAADRAAIAASIMNRWTLVNGDWDVIATTRNGGGPIRLSDWGRAGMTVGSIVFAANQYEPWASSWTLTASAQARSNSALSSEYGFGQCNALVQSIGTAAGFWAARSTTELWNTTVNGEVLFPTSFSAAARGNQPTKAFYEVWIGSFGSANVFSGLTESQVVPRGSVAPWDRSDPPGRGNGTPRPGNPGKIAGRGRPVI